VKYGLKYLSIKHTNFSSTGRAISFQLPVSNRELGLDAGQYV
jgi:hypothetical protein